jgi:hypothetical protein
VLTERLLLDLGSSSFFSGRLFDLIRLKGFPVSRFQLIFISRCGVPHSAFRIPHSAFRIFCPDCLLPNSDSTL